MVKHNYFLGPNLANLGTLSGFPCMLPEPEVEPQRGAAKTLCLPWRLGRCS
jgi:hypothetical protein